MIPKYPDMDRIDNISAELAQRFAVLYDKIATLTAERDEARRMVCEWHSGLRVQHPQDYAKRRSWDCYKEDGK
jgi:hypothetical protein